MVPDIYEFFGLPVRFRTETRAGNKDTLILSLWKSDFPLSHFENQTSSMVLESTPMRLSKIERKLSKIYPESKNLSITNTSSDKKNDLCIIDLAVLNFLGGVLEHPSVPVLANSSPEETTLLNARQKKAQHDRDALLSLAPLPLSAIIASFWDKLLDEANRKKETVAEDRRVLLILLTACGTIPWQEATPSTCAPCFSGLSVTRKKSCVRLLRKLFDLMYEEGIITFDPWEEYQLPESRSPPSYTTQVAHNIEACMLSGNQLCALLEYCFSSLAHWDIRFGFFLAATQGLSFEEICGLNAGDISYLSDYPSRLVVHIRHEFRLKEGNKNCSFMEIADEHLRRVLPLPKLSAPFYEEHIKGMASNAPIIQNHSRRMPPTLLKSLFGDFLCTLLRPPFTEVGALQPSSAHKLLQQTVWAGLRSNGYEEEELRYHRGMKPLLTSAKSYCDFSNATQLNTMGSIQDSWLFSLLRQKLKQQENPSDTVLPHRGQELSWSSTQPMRRTEIILTIDLASVPSTCSELGLILEFSANHALSGKAQYTGGNNE